MIDAAPGNGAAREAAAGRVVVVIPTLDEEQSIADVVRGMPRAIVSRVIVADGGSRDATAARAKAAGADVIDAGRGYGRAWLAAAMGAEGAGHRGVQGGDRADGSASVAGLGEPVRSGRFDFGVGSPSRGKRERGRNRLHQLAAGRLAGWGMGLLYGVGYTDMCAL